MSTSNIATWDQYSRSPPSWAVAGTGSSRWCDACISAFARRHERVLVCTACDRAPAAVLCAACDTDVHSSRPLARRHLISPVPPLPPPGGGDDGDNDGLFFLGEEVDQYLDLADLNGLEYAKQQLRGSDGVVPVNLGMAGELFKHHQHLGLATPLNNSASVSSMEASIVPDVAVNEVSNVGPLPIKPLAGGQLPFPPTQFSSIDREARVLRYREKRKARNFEKTIRYASRKAYAEARPRIRGRFARRTDVDTDDAEKKLSCSAAADDNYGIVPSF